MTDKAKSIVVISMIAVFVVGVFCGVFLDKSILEPRRHQRARERRPEPFPTLETMAGELALTSDQQARIEEVFQANHERLKIMHHELRRRFSDLRTQLLDEIKSVLTPEQIGKFDAMIAVYHARNEERRKKEEERRKKEAPQQKSKDTPVRGDKK